MTSFPATTINEELSELEMETIESFIVRECVYIVEEELEYFFAQREKVLQLVSGGINLNMINARELQQKVDQALVSPQDITILLQKIQKRILRELSKTNCRYTFHLNQHTVSKDLPQFDFSIAEQLRTLKLGRTVARGIDMAWKKACNNVLPKEMSKISNRVRMGDHLLSALAMNPKEQEKEITAGYLRAARATLKQYQAELMNAIVREITSQLFKYHNQCDAAEEMPVIKYA